jgi:hypothetical protein
MKNIIIFGLVMILLLGCEKENKTENSNLVDSFDLLIGDCYTSIGQSKICFDTILADSRCAPGANCTWEGNATIKLSLALQDNKRHDFELNTNANFPIDTIIENIYILLTDLTPYPEISMEILPNDYKAKLKMVNIDELENNAKIIAFNPDKCSCCWGWTIKIGNDTIKSDDELIGKIVGYKRDYPVNIFLEKGDFKQTCSDMGGYDYYRLKTLIKIE